MKYGFSLTRLGFTTASIVMTSILLVYDVVFSGAPILSFFVVPIWFLGAIVRAAIQRPGWLLSMKRIAIPLIIGGIVCGNAWLQNSIAQSRCDVVVQACKQYQKDKGHYPNKLGDLVPSYLPRVPWAKYCLMYGVFHYIGGSGDLRPMLTWTKDPPFGLSYYDFKDGRYGYMD